MDINYGDTVNYNGVDMTVTDIAEFDTLFVAFDGTKHHIIDRTLTQYYKIG